MIYPIAKIKKPLLLLILCVKKGGAKLQSSTQSLKCVQNIRVIYVNFSSIHRKVKTEVWLSLTFMMWTLAISWHLISDFKNEEDNQVFVFLQIAAGFLFAAGFG